MKATLIKDSTKKTRQTDRVPRSHQRKKPLTAIEITACGTLSGITIVSGLLGSIVPIFNPVFILFAVIPVAMLAVRMRLRVSVSAFIATLVVALSIGGLPTFFSMLSPVIIGALIGTLKRRNIHMLWVTFFGAILGVTLGALSDLVLWLLADLRQLFLESVRVSSTGFLKLLKGWEPLIPLASFLEMCVNAMVTYWWVWVPATVFMSTVFFVPIAYWLLGAVLHRIPFGSSWDPFVAQSQEAFESGDFQQQVKQPGGEYADNIRPLPIVLTDVCMRYPQADSDAISGINIEIGCGEFVAITGENGSGKSTLGLVLSGAHPTSGSVTRPGQVGLGQEGGIAVLAQRTELQILGETVAEDVLWGLSPEKIKHIDLDSLLHHVGLGGKGDQRVRHLSGGQLQRLALAGALASKPSLIVSDESTAMIDQEGRKDLMKTLRSLTTDERSIIHITHDPSEAAIADRLIALDAGRVIYDGDPRAYASQSDTSSDTQSLQHLPSPSDSDISSAPENFPDRGTSAPDDPQSWLPKWETPKQDKTLSLRNVSYAYNVSTPWQKEVLHDISLDIFPADGILIMGDNGSGKTTLARILTGLLPPTWGECLLGEKAMSQRIGDVGLSMQFARLQLQRPTIRLDIAAAAGLSGDSDPEEIDRIARPAMAEVGLSWNLASRNIDELSGGQLRRVALAGLLAANPSMIVLDEPLAGLDQQSRSLVIEALQHRRRQGSGIIVISHDTEGLDSVCNQLYILEKGVLTFEGSTDNPHESR